MQKAINVTAKLGKMRKAQEFSVYPRNNDTEPVVVQSDKSIGRFDPVTRKGKLWIGKGAHPGFMQLAFGDDYEFPQEFVDACLVQKPGAVSLGSVMTAVPDSRKAGAVSIFDL